MNDRPTRNDYDQLIDQLTGMEKVIFRKLYAGSVAQKMYRMYEFRK